MPRMRIALLIGVLAAIALASAVAQSSLNDGAAAGPKKVIYMSAVEYKGSTSSEPFPSAEPPAGGGYILKPPDANGKWETSTYRWEPGTIIVNQGDEVELWIWGVNGSQHPATVEGYVPEFTVTRGNLTIVKFTADQTGTFRITCHVHQPSMEAQLVVLGASASLQTPPSPTVAPAKLPTSGGGLGWGDGSFLVGAGLVVLAVVAGVAGLSLVVRRSRR